MSFQHASQMSNKTTKSDAGEGSSADRALCVLEKKLHNDFKTNITPAADITASTPLPSFQAYELSSDARRQAQPYCRNTLFGI